MNYLIKLENLTKSYKIANEDVCVLKDINLNIKRGEFISIVGQSGSGKSTLMNIIGCLDALSSGKYIFNRQDISNFSKNDFAKVRREKFGFIFQRYNLIPSMSALENTALPSIYDGVLKSDREKSAQELLCKFGLEDKLSSKPNMLSGGQQQRVSIARALINGAEVILADEPTGALDSKSGLEVMQVLRNLHMQGKTIILVTHDLNIASYANRIIGIKDGKIVSDSIKEELIYSFKEIKKSSKDKLNYYKDRFYESFKMSISSIFSHKLRSLLTMLGIIIGITAVISVVALGQGSREQILESIQKIGTNTIDIIPGKSYGDMRADKIKTLTLSDAKLLQKQDFLDSVTPNTLASGFVTYKSKTFYAILKGGGDKSLDVSGLKLKSGRMFDKQDLLNSSSVVVIDENSQKLLFKNNKKSIGSVIFFDKKPFVVIGIYKNSNEYNDPSRLSMYAPYTTVLNKVTGKRHISSITARVKDGENSQMAEKTIIKLITAKHGIKDFFTTNSDTIKKLVENTISNLRLLISSIAFISLLVGGIGVMNIMLVSVTERTREIGIKMAIGAKQTDILMQFLLESVLLCIIGGIVGIVFSYFVGYVINNFFVDFKMIFSNTSILVAILTSTITGVVFGYIPAKNASKLNPIDALSRE